MKLGITFALPTLNLGGAERVLVSLARNLSQVGHDVSVVVLNASGALAKNLPSSVQLVALRARRASLCVPELVKALKFLEPDLLVSTTHHMNVASSVAARLAHIGNVALRCPSTPSREAALGHLSLFTRLTAGWAYRGSRHVLAQTEEMKKDIVAVFGVDPARIKVLHNPVDTELIDLELAGAKNPYDASKINIVAAGRLSREKGVDILIRSFGAVVARDRRFLLHVIGRDGGEETALRALAVEMGLRDHVVFWGEQQNPYPFLNFADLFVLPSRYEGLPNAVLESVYLKRPIVATRVVPILERLIDDGKSGILVPIEDEVRLTEAILRYDSLTGAHRPLPTQDVAAFFAELVSGQAH